MIPKFFSTQGKTSGFNIARTFQLHRPNHSSCFLKGAVGAAVSAAAQEETVLPLEAVRLT